MRLKEVYDENYQLLGSPKMVAFFEALCKIPHAERKVTPTLSSISITSDGYIIIGGEFYGSVDELEDNLDGLCDHFGADRSETKTLMQNTTDWRTGGNAWNR